MNLGCLPGQKSSTNPLSVGSTAPSAILTLPQSTMVYPVGFSFFSFLIFVFSVFVFVFFFFLWVLFFKFKTLKIETETKSK